MNYHSSTARRSVIIPSMWPSCPYLRPQVPGKDRRCEDPQRRRSVLRVHMHVDVVMYAPQSIDATWAKSHRDCVPWTVTEMAQNALRNYMGRKTPQLRALDSHCVEGPPKHRLVAVVGRASRPVSMRVPMCSAVLAMRRPSQQSLCDLTRALH